MEITLYKGDNLTVPFVFQRNEQPLSIVGATITLKAKRFITDIVPLIDMSVGDGITITDDGSPNFTGMFNVDFIPADTSSISIDNRRMDLIIIVAVTIMGVVHTSEGVLHLLNV